MEKKAVPPPKPPRGIRMDTFRDRNVTVARTESLCYNPLKTEPTIQTPPVAPNMFSDVIREMNSSTRQSKGRSCLMLLNDMPPESPPLPSPPSPYTIEDGAPPEDHNLSLAMQTAHHRRHRSQSADQLQSSFSLFHKSQPKMFTFLKQEEEEYEKEILMEEKSLLTHLVRNTSQMSTKVIDIPCNVGSYQQHESSTSTFDSDDDDLSWNPAVDKSGKVYVYPPNGGDSKWNLQEYDNVLNSPSSPSPSLSSSDAEIRSMEPYEKDLLQWRFNLKEKKKVKKNWSRTYVNYFPNAKKTRSGKSYGTLTFTKRPNDAKKYDYFDLVPECNIDSNLKKLNTICLHNGEGTEILLQADNPHVVAKWTKILIEKDNVQKKALASDKEKRSQKDRTLVKKESSDDSDTTKGIKDSLILFFKKRSQKETLTKKGIYKDTVFGSTIGDICLKEQFSIPVFVLQCIKNIEKDEVNFKMDGLYRISGNASKIQKIRIEIAQNRYPILMEEKDVHNLTGSLKLFFRELKEPLIPFANYQSFIQATGSEYLKNRLRSDALRQAVKKLPNCNRETLKLLLRHLLKINQYEHENRMSVMNLAIVFGPCLLWPETTSGYDLMTDAMLHNRVVEGLLTDFEEVFKCPK